MTTLPGRFKTIGNSWTGLGNVWITPGETSQRVYIFVGVFGASRPMESLSKNRETGIPRLQDTAQTSDLHIRSQNSLSTNSHADGGADLIGYPFFGSAGWTGHEARQCCAR